MSSSPPVLLTAGHAYGTLAAARSLGRAGVPVTLAEGNALAPTRWSRHVTRRVRCPDPGETPAFLTWLMDFGAASPGHVLLPCSDEVAWLVAESRDALAGRFHMIPVPFTAVDELLDKARLHDHCHAVGLDVPETRFPRSEEEAVALAGEVGFPLVVKPRTQILLDSHSKGALVESADQLVPRFRDFLARNHYGERIRARNPDVVWPMLQRYHAAARRSIYSLSGYAGAEGEVVCVRAARKIFQRPRKLGIGLCFEAAEADERLVGPVRALCRRVGYRGVFEVEIVEDGSRSVLIDFNPRFYGQMAFDVDRGLPLPRLAYADALGDAAAFEALVAGARAAGPAPPSRVYCHRFLFEVMLRGQRLSGRLPSDEARYWRRWWSDHRAAATDAVADARDPAPWVADVTSHVAAIARHPRSFVRSVLLDQ